MAPATSARNADASRPRTALICDADRDTRELYRCALAPADFDVLEAEDGREALARVYSARPDVVVADVRLAYITGFELCRLLRSDGATSKLPILTITADPSPEAILRLREFGADAILVKPFPLESLATEVLRIGTQQRRFNDQPRASRRVSKVRAKGRFVTTNPTQAAPTLRCPLCDTDLHYDRSHIGGVSDRHPEQWDYLVCERCGTFQYRHRTRKLRHIA